MAGVELKYQQDSVACPACGCELISTGSRETFMDSDDIEVDCNECGKEYTINVQVAISFAIWPEDTE